MTANGPASADRFYRLLPETGSKLSLPSCVPLEAAGKAASPFLFKEWCRMVACKTYIILEMARFVIKKKLQGRHCRAHQLTELSKLCKLSLRPGVMWSKCRLLFS